jgi:tetratricopeptide (TPR) repeat protein
MIVKNEEQMLPCCLDSVQGLADEIIIVDTGSTDGTAEIARRYNARCYSYQWNDDFSAARNFSLQYASGKWILVLDADERLMPEQAEKIKRLLQKTDGIAFYLNFRSRIRESATGAYAVSAHPRLFKNRLGIRFSGRIHEQIIESVQKAGGTIGPTDIFVEHEGYSPERMTDRKKIERNIAILRKELEENPENGMMYFYAGECYSLFEQWDEAIRWYTEGSQKKNIPPDNAAILYQNLGTAYLNAGNIQEAYRAERFSLKLLPERITPHIVIAETALAEGNYDLAIWEYQTVLEAAERTETGVFDRLFEHIFSRRNTVFRLGQAYFLNKDYDNAEVCFTEAARSELSHKRDDEAHKWLAKTFFAAKRLDEAEALIDEIMLRYPQDAEALTIKGKITGSRGKLDEALDYFSKALSVNPSYMDARCDAVRILLLRGDIMSAKRLIPLMRDTPDKDTAPGLMKLYAEILLRTGDTGEAKKILEKLIAENTADAETYFLCAYAADALDNTDDVLRFCAEAAKRNPADIRIYILQGNVLIKMERYAEAITVLQQAARLKPSRVIGTDVWRRLGLAAVKQEKYNLAKDAFEQAHRLQPDDDSLKRTLAGICGKLGLLQEAEKYVRMIKNP